MYNNSVQGMYTNPVLPCYDYMNCFQYYHGCLVARQALLSMLFCCFLLLYFIYTVIPSSCYYPYPLVLFLRSYSYKPLDTRQDEIRLIKLQAPIKSRPLCGNIIHVPLNAESRYWALSYCWGSLAGKRTLVLDGKKLQITVNLDDALRQLGNSYGMLWVDAICINQADIPERSREVLRMGEIYSLASGVVAWLGVADKTSDRAMDFLQVLATKEPRSQYDEYLKELPTEDAPGKFGNEWTGLKDLAKRGYWSRTWIVQEQALCQRSKVFHCGTKFLPWDIFEKVFCPNINDPRVFSEANTCITNVVFDTQELPEVCAGLDNLHVLSNLQRPEILQFIALHDLFQLTSSFRATDPRDKIYGMLGLSEKVRNLVPHPDYAKSKDLVFRELTRELLAAVYNLALICLKLPTHVNRSDVVSWVPNWDVHGLWAQSPDWLLQAIQDSYMRGRDSADARKDAVISKCDRHSPILRLRGLSYDRVDGLGPTVTRSWTHRSKEAGGKRYDVVKPDHSQNAYGSDVDTFRALKQLSQEIFRISRTDISEAVRLGYSVHNECLIPRVYRQIAFLGHNSSRTEQWLQQTEEFTFVGRSLRQWYDMAYAHVHTFQSASTSSVVQQDPELDAMVKCITRVRLDQWRWLSTDRGYLGRTHPQAQKGDEIVIIQGCTVPMVLRPCGQFYSVVCAAYVQGIMNGEALQGVRDDHFQYFDLA